MSEREHDVEQTTAKSIEKISRSAVLLENKRAAWTVFMVALAYVFPIRPGAGSLVNGLFSI
jgi:hypothetical protein